ncbi:helix-turn-helix domain-containing protein [Streptococcus pneumoniae]|jgi:XRE family transcriptional regulator|uniref:XRE family transcriptional regulator n=2 Tax=Streptococcus mitis TaxID=28037 RepID=V8I754_STRMT|nr:helix-turn-helix transcriptional regulator [Streptococcus mitis]MDV8587537.1 helix-turn-helix domain-containing protein [Streptococcus pneumoniae]QBX08951.1 DNA-binding protein [Streptococcus satellite phage Javan303]QBX09344.1 DNA-binding protein [Streptococcus satellite phage Javan335]EID28514.1 DNA-binding helix-turn-helix protein [Streptococcus mitis SK575]ETD96018.1 XRE family transcriptional regulator [Streptococcus mitis 21/39]
MSRLKELRQERKLTQQELAKQIGVSKLTILNWEKGEHQIKSEKAQQLADIFGVSVGYLLGFNNDDVTEYEIDFHNNVMERMNKEAFVRFLDYISLSDIVLSDKQIEMIFYQLQDLSELNSNYRYTETDTEKLKSMYSVKSNYIPTENILKVTNSLYKDDTIEEQFKQYKKIID